MDPVILFVRFICYCSCPPVRNGLRDRQVRHLFYAPISPRSLLSAEVYIDLGFQMNCHFYHFVRVYYSLYTLLPQAMKI